MLLPAPGFDSRHLHCFAFAVLKLRSASTLNISFEVFFCFIAEKQWPFVALAKKGFIKNSYDFCKNVSMYFVYILKSKIDESYYVGVTKNVKRRIKEHNSGSSIYSNTKRPYVLVWCCLFPSKNKALIFERYLKSGSGFAFRNRHLI